MNDSFSEFALDLAKRTDAECAVVLIGSAARRCRTEASDIDILFIAKENVASLPVLPGFHVKFASEVDFVRRLQAGEDFEAWCVRYGVTLLDRGIWERTKASFAGVWPRWETKVVHGIGRLFLASDLSAMGDDPAAQEELIFVLGHIARGLLLKNGVFPLSRPELAQQVKELGYPQLAALHERLRVAVQPSKTDISLGLHYSKKLLIHLDRDNYGRIALEHGMVIRNKEVELAEMRLAGKAVKQKRY